MRVSDVFAVTGLGGKGTKISGIAKDGMCSSKPRRMRKDDKILLPNPGPFQFSPHVRQVPPPLMNKFMLFTGYEAFLRGHL